MELSRSSRDRSTRNTILTKYHPSLGHLFCHSNPSCCYPIPSSSPSCPFFLKPILLPPHPSIGSSSSVFWGFFVYTDTGTDDVCKLISNFFGMLEFLSASFVVFFGRYIGGISHIQVGRADSGAMKLSPWIGRSLIWCRFNTLCVMMSPLSTIC